MKLLGLRADSVVVATVPALGATGVLYAGPLLMAFLDWDPTQADVRVS